MPSVRTLVTIASIALVALYSLLATTSSGELTSVAWPMLVVAIGLPLWFEARFEKTEPVA